jgi:hypothetical protein
LKIPNGWCWICDVISIGLAAVIGVVVIVLLVLLAALSKSVEFPELVPLVGKLDLEQAELQHLEALNTGARHFETKPNLSMHRKEFEYYMALAILTKDRVHNLQGLPNGPKIRKKWRPELKARMKQIADGHNSDGI